jgi:hypothetical protein
MTNIPWRAQRNTSALPDRHSGAKTKIELRESDAIANGSVLRHPKAL